MPNNIHIKYIITHQNKEVILYRMSAASGSKAAWNENDSQQAN